MAFESAIYRAMVYRTAVWRFIYVDLSTVIYQPGHATSRNHSLASARVRSFGGGTVVRRNRQPTAKRAAWPSFAGRSPVTRSGALGNSGGEGQKRKTEANATQKPRVTRHNAPG